MALARARPRGLLRLVLRLPVGLYRCHLGWLLGQRFLLLTHRGRRTGTLRRTVVEVVDREPGTYVAASGWGDRSDWFRNVVAHPSVTVTVGRHPHRATAEVLTAAEAAQRLHRYGTRHPRSFRSLTGILLGERLPADPVHCLRLAESTPVVAFRCAPDRPAARQP